MLGRTLYAREIYRMVIAENVVNAYRSQASAKSAAEWARDNPGLRRTLDQARELKLEMYGND